MKVLHLTLKKKWFDMILSVEKTEEYREIKPYWVSRLSSVCKGAIGGDFMSRHRCNAYLFMSFDIVRFTNGYSKNAPTMDLEFKTLSIGRGNAAWGAPEYDVFIISLGKILSTKNINHPS